MLHLKLWQFLVYLLNYKKSTKIIRWIDISNHTFELVKPEEVARQWGMHKNRKAMNYEKLSRSLRYYYEMKIIEKVRDKIYAYRFLCNINISSQHLIDNNDNKIDFNIEIQNSNQPSAVIHTNSEMMTLANHYYIKICELNIQLYLATQLQAIEHHE